MLTCETRLDLSTNVEFQRKLLLKLRTLTRGEKRNIAVETQKIKQLQFQTPFNSQV